MLLALGALAAFALLTKPKERAKLANARPSLPPSESLGTIFAGSSSSSTATGMEEAHVSTSAPPVVSQPSEPVKEVIAVVLAPLDVPTVQREVLSPLIVPAQEQPSAPAPSVPGPIVETDPPSLLTYNEEPPSVLAIEPSTEVKTGEVAPSVAISFLQPMTSYRRKGL